MRIPRIGWLIALGLLVILYFMNRSDIKVLGQDGFELRQIAGEGYELKSVIHLDNPNLLSSTIKSIREEYRVNGVLIGIAEMGIEQGIPGRKQTDFPIGMRFDYNSLLSRITIDSSTKNLSVEVKGELVFSNFISGGQAAINQTATIPLP